MERRQMIPVYEPLFLGNEKKYLNDCIDSGWVSSEGKYVKIFEEKFAEWAGTQYAVAVCNGTAALEVALWADGVRKGYVLVPDFTIISCPIAIQQAGAMPYFMETDTIDGCINANGLPYIKDPEQIQAIMPVHLWGNRCNMKKIESWALPLGVKIIEDCSQFWTKPSGVKHIGCYSLYANKLITAGEGGVIVMNDTLVYERAKKYRDLCHGERRFTHEALGYNFRMSNLQAAVALAQLEKIDEYAAIKTANFYVYLENLPSNVELVNNPEYVPWMYVVSSKNPHQIYINNMEKVQKELAQKGIETRLVFHTLSNSGLFFNPKLHGDVSHHENYQLILPSGLTLKQKDIKYVCQMVGKYL